MCLNIGVFSLSSKIIYLVIQSFTLSLKGVKLNVLYSNSTDIINATLEIAIHKTVHFRYWDHHTRQWLYHSIDSHTDEDATITGQINDNIDHITKLLKSYNK